MTGPEPEGGDAVRLRADVLRFALRCVGWSQAEFARRLNVHESTVSRALDRDRPSNTTVAVARRVLALFPGLTFPEVVDVGPLSPRLPDGIDDTAPVSGSAVPADTPSETPAAIPGRT
jgi:hypothetical protein